MKNLPFFNHSKTLQTLKMDYFLKLSQKKYRKAEYVQRRVCFVNVQSSFLFLRAHALPRMLYLLC